MLRVRKWVGGGGEEVERLGRKGRVSAQIPPSNRRSIANNNKLPASQPIGPGSSKMEAHQETGLPRNGLITLPPFKFEPARAQRE